MARIFGTTSQSQQQQELLGFPQQLQAQETDGAEKVFLHGISKPGVFEKEIASLDEKDGDTAGRLLCWAADTNKHPDVIKKLGEKCGDFSATLRGRPPLICAVVNGHASAVKQLLALGAPVNAVTKDEGDFFSCASTALHCAVGISDAGIVSTLLAEGAEVNYADGLGKTALHYACDVAAVDVAVELLKHGADVNKEDKTLKTPVQIAVTVNSCALMRSLISFGKKPSALAAASFVEQCRGTEGREEMFELLVERRWGPRDRKVRGSIKPVTVTAPTASAAAAPAKGDASARPRAPVPRAGSGLHRAARTGDLDRLKELLSSGEDPSAQDVCGLTPLHLAARLGHVEVVQTLLRAKAAPDARDVSSLTPLLTAAKAGKAAVVAALLKGGAKPDLKDSKECSALDIAVRFRFHAVVKALVDGKASVNAGGEKGLTPLHAACKMGTAAIVDTLLSAGALPGHCWNDLLQSPLMVACEAGDLDVVNLLLPRLSERQINMRDRVIGEEEGGVTALVIAIEYSSLGGKMDIVQALLDNRADPSIRMTSNNVSALEQVVICDNTRLNPTLGPRMVRALTKAGAKVNELGSQGCTPLHQACCAGACGEVVQALLDAGADASAPCAGFQFMSPLQLTGCGGNPGALRVMIGLPECGGLNTVGAPPERSTVLACAVMYGSTEGVRFLLEEGADMDLLPFEEDGVTPKAKSLIHLAMAGGHGDAVSLLLQAKQFKRESERLAGGGGIKVAP